MEKYTECKPFINNPNFRLDRRTTLENLDVNMIDSPLRKLVRNINMLPCIFTLQCCHGHFLSKDGEEISSFDLSEGEECVKYRLAYIALCLENSLSGKQIREKLINIPSSIDRENIQFFSAQWFWEQWSNSYAIQVMPKRFKNFDTAQLDKSEAMKIASLRDNLFSFLNDFAAEISC